MSKLYEALENVQGPVEASIDKLVRVIEVMDAALKEECCCPGEKSWTTGEEIFCNCCDARIEVLKILENK